MAKVKTTVKLDIKAALKDFLDANTANEIGTAIVDNAKRMIAAGISPVAGEGGFEAYSSQRGNKRGYPKSILWKYPQKQRRPVNLTLSGAMLSHYGHRQKSSQSVEVGILSGGDKIQKIAQAHNSGVPSKNIPMRAFVPKNGEEFAMSIMRILKGLYTQRLSAIIRKSNGR